MILVEGVEILGLTAVEGSARLRTFATTISAEMGCFSYKSIAELIVSAMSNAPQSSLPFLAAWAR